MDLQVACWQHVNVGGGRSQPADTFSSGQGKQAIRFRPYSIATRHISWNHSQQTVTCFSLLRFVREAVSIQVRLILL